jgi:hypothetical protein
VTGHYILDAYHHLVEVDLMTWARWYETADRTVKETFLEDGTRISTVFLGLNHRFAMPGPPLVFETMVFNSDGDAKDCWRYSSWDDAVAGHDSAVRRAIRQSA